MATGFPVPLAWENRAKSVEPFTGGYDGYLDSLRTICEIVDDLRPTPAALADEIRQRLDVTEGSARQRAAFLQKAGWVEVREGRCRLAGETKQWLETGSADILIAVLHSRCRFIGEMVAELAEPLSTDEVRSIAARYGLELKTTGQIDNRRGWLQSAGLIRVTEERRLVATGRGRALAGRLELHKPSATAAFPGDSREGRKEAPMDAPVPPPQPVETAGTADALAAEILAASTDSKNPDRFEEAVKDAFAFLGFDARKLGGPGKTDVLLDASLDKGASYRVAIDCKTVGSGALGDQQVDWMTLREHRRKHRSQYSMLIGPNPSSGRLMKRAEENKVAVLSASLMAGLCQQHAEAPLGLADYRTLFARQTGARTWERRGGEVDTFYLDEAAAEAPRLRGLVAAILRVLSERCMDVGPLRARDLWLILLERGETAEGSSEDEIQELLQMLANPLIRAIDGSPEEGYALSSRTSVTRLRLEHLTDSVDPASGP